MNYKQNRNRLMETEDRLTAAGGQEVVGLGEKCEVIKQKQKEKVTDTDNSMVIARG